MAPALSVDLTLDLSVGIALNIWNHTITGASEYIKSELTSGTGTAINDESFVVEFERTLINRFQVDEGYSFVIGGLDRLGETWTFGTVLKPAYTLKLGHSRTFGVLQSGDFPFTIPEMTSHNDSRLKFPLIFGAGTSWRPVHEFSVSMDVTWTEWSRYEFEEDGFRTNPISNNLISEGRLEDTYTLRIGAEYLFIREDFLVLIRWGFGYVPSPALDEVDDFYTLNLGIGLQVLDRINVDVAYEFRWGKDVNGSLLHLFDATEDIDQHRILGSMIYYF